MSQLGPKQITILKRFKEVLIEKNKIEDEYKQLEAEIKSWGEGEFENDGIRCLVSFIKASYVTEESKQKAIEKAQNLEVGSISRSESWKLTSKLKD